MVYVLNKNGQPLMPTMRHGRVKHLLRKGLAKVVKRCPFTIKLLYETTDHTQDVILGIDTGSGTIGAGAYAPDGSILYRSEVEVRNDIHDRMERRKKYRRNRRNRKTRYRKARWQNRKNSRKEGRLSPTVVSKLHSHVKEIEYVKSILPVTELVLELGAFDPHLLKDPSLAEDTWGYQHGPDYGYENTRAMVLERDGHKCQSCKGKHKDPKLEVHHIIFRSNGGSDDSENLTTLCHTCHKKLHAGKLKLKLTGKQKDALKHATQMNVICSQLRKMYPEAIETFGYVTKVNRVALGLEKEHDIDACVIASGGKPFEIQSPLYRKVCVAEGDMQRSKGVRSEQKIPDGKIGGFQKFDKVRYLDEEYFIKGRMSTGYAILMDIHGKTVDFSDQPKGFKTPKMQNMERLEARSGWMVAMDDAPRTA